MPAALPPLTLAGEGGLCVAALCTGWCVAGVTAWHRCIAAHTLTLAEGKAGV